MYLQEGTLLQDGKYRIVRYISHGGFGATYEAVHTRLPRRFAIKEFFVEDFCGRDESTQQVTLLSSNRFALVDKLKSKFIEEAEAISTLDHPGIVRVSDVFEENGTAYFVMNYIDGQTLSEMVRTQPLSEAQMLKYIHQIASALDHVHRLNRLHLDIKPGNIIIDRNDNAVLIDFGASKQYDEVNGQNNSTLIGQTPGFAPLEQMGNDVGRFMPATDIYALGATMYQLLTGNVPTAANKLACGEVLVPIPENVASPATIATIYRCLAVRAEDRPQSIGEFLSMLNTPVSQAQMMPPQSSPQPKTAFVQNAQPMQQPISGQTMPQQPISQSPYNAQPAYPGPAPMQQPMQQPFYPGQNPISQQPAPSKGKSGILKWIIIGVVAVVVIIGALVLLSTDPELESDTETTSLSEEEGNAAEPKEISPEVAQINDEIDDFEAQSFKVMDLSEKVLAGNLSLASQLTNEAAELEKMSVKLQAKIGMMTKEQKERLEGINKKMANIINRKIK